MDNFILNSNPPGIIFSILDIIEKIKNKEDISFLSSGTTGEPKIITHQYSTIIKNIKKKEELKNSIWGLTYDPTKIAASQVILQSYMNGGKIVNLFGKKPKDIIDLIKDYRISHLSATPTFYRMLGDSIFKEVKQITFGGEILDRKLLEISKKKFPNAKIKNIYALTEFGTLLASESEIFTISKNNSSFIKIDKNKIFVKWEGDWKDTGDLVEQIDSNRFIIIGRNSNILNIGGYNINPIKIELIINSLDYIKNSYVYGINNSVTGKIICSDIILNYRVDKSKIISDLSERLNRYEIPRKLNIVNQIDLNSTGKILRK
jgi:acyl-coenzyme A synthetase/AMP-(fatty) acid ligase